MSKLTRPVDPTPEITVLEDAIATKSQAVETPPDTWDAFVEQHPREKVSFAVFNILQKFVGAMNEKNIERNRRLDELEARCLELEAANAAQKVQI